MVYTINEKKIIANKGDLLFIPHKSRRSAKNHETGAHQKYTTLFFSPIDNGEIGIPYLDQKRFLKFKPRNFEYFKQKFELIFIDLRGNKKYRSFICLGILNEVIGMIARELEATETSPMKLKYAQAIQDYLLENYRRNIEIDQLAMLVKKSPNYIIAIFKEFTGQTPIRYVHHLRIIEACNLLLYSDMSIVNISDYLGYYDTSYFSRTFKKITSLSPKEYMKLGGQAEVISFSKIYNV